MSGEYENPVKLRVSFDRPESTIVVLQGPALDAYFEWQESGDDGDYDYFLDELHNQLEDHIVTYTMIRDVDPAR
jgi:hypothetical protein